MSVRTLWFNEDEEEPTDSLRRSLRDSHDASLGRDHDDGRHSELLLEDKRRALQDNASERVQEGERRLQGTARDICRTR